MVARRAHNPKVVGSNPAPATKYKNPLQSQGILLYAVFIVAWIDWKAVWTIVFQTAFLLADVIGG